MEMHCSVGNRGGYEGRSISLTTQSRRVHMPSTSGPAGLSYAVSVIVQYKSKGRPSDGIVKRENVYMCKQ